MAAPLKKRDLESDNKKSLNKTDESEGSSDEDSVGSNNEELTGQEEIQVDFEGRNPVDSDFHGIKQLLQQLFLKAHVNLSELTDLLIKQNYIGSVVKQSEIDDDSDEDDMDTNDVFGVTSVVSLTDKQNLECIQQLRSLLQDMCRTHGTDQANTAVSALLQNDSRPIGLIINERFVNIPAQIAIPLLENLSKEMTRACQKKMPFDFAHLILICKLYRTEVKKKKKARGKAQEPEVLWSNPEEEVIDQFADARFEFCVKAESDTGLAGMWTEDDGEMVPYRRVLVFRASRLPEVLEAVRNFVSG